jgi:hypothetical protein
MIRESISRWSKIFLGMLAVGFIPIISGCGGRGDFTLGNPTTKTISSGDREVELSGYTFRFPDGGSGNLTVSKIISGPKAPFPGEGLYVEYEGSDPMELVFHRTEDYLMVMGYGKVQGMFDDKIGNRERWFTLPWEELKDGRIAFDLTAFGVPPETSPAKAPAKKQEVDRLKHFWISKLPAASDEVEKRVLLGLQASDYTQDFLDALSPERRRQVEARIRERSLTTEHDGNYYKGFWWRSLGGWGRIFHPTVHVTLDGFSLAHELGHYFTHLLVGDDVESALEGQGSLFGEHGIRGVVGRGVVLEEYAYLVEFFLKGTGGQYNLHELYDMFRGLLPEETDFPSLEGFGSAMLAVLSRTGQRMREVSTGESVDVPVMGLSYQRIFEIIAKGATDIDRLRQNIMDSLSAEEAEKFTVVMGIMGWQYFGRGRLLDPKGSPLSGVTVEPLAKVGTKEYSLSPGFKAKTDKDGKFVLPFIFPGKSYLRITQGKQVTDIPISLDWNLPTNNMVDLGNITVTQARVQDTRYISIIEMTFCGDIRYEYYSWYGGIIVKTSDRIDEDCLGGNYKNLPVTWSGNSFSASHPEDTGAWTFSGNVDETGQGLAITAEGQFQISETTNECKVTESWHYRIMGRNIPRDGRGDLPFRYYIDDVSHGIAAYYYSRTMDCENRSSKYSEVLAKLKKYTTEIIFSVEPLPW